MKDRLRWQSMRTYEPGSPALFWVNDGVAEYPVYGAIEKRTADNKPTIWDDNDFGYDAANAVLWTPFKKPTTAEIRLTRRRWQIVRFFWHVRNGKLRSYGYSWLQIWELCRQRSKDVIG